MCDLFWLSPGEQGDLSDVVRASLHPPHQLPTPAADEEEEDEYSSLLLEGGGGGGGLVVGHGDEQLGMVAMMMGGNNSSRPPSSDHHVISLHSPPATTYTRPHPEPLAGMLRRPGFEREGDMVVGPPPEIGDRLQHMSIAHHPRVPTAMKPRKSQSKKVVCIPAPTAAPGASGRHSTSGEVVPSDLWAWRKYGQKPIKGSPYPRGYYRCSSSKGCPARKQVERSRTDPNMLVITYTSDHNHPWPTQRNALAGSTRPSSSSATAAKIAASSSSSLAAAAARNSSNTNVDVDCVGAHHQLKQESDLDLFADMDALSVFSSIDKIQEDDSKQQLFDPFSSGFCDYI
ncbi:probable WRKY transcription factor 4 [Triticum urartu]|uniref:WRKY domain-containing protein n=2 Tax=Triticum urartu TaxID=4572 RepID=A0A8R7JZH1_TRIUA|nr:probable WRKY transcription factor 4 [Triticum urartu]